MNQSLREAFHAEAAGVHSLGDIDAAIAEGQARRRRTYWMGAAAVAACVAGALVLAQYGLVGRAPATPVTATPAPSASTHAAPGPITPEQWLQFSQVGVNGATSVHEVAQIAPGVDVDVVLTQRGAEGTISARGVTSRYVAVDGVTYIEPAALMAAKLSPVRTYPPGTWLRIPPPPGRFGLPESMSPGSSIADASRWTPTFTAGRLIDGRSTRAIQTDITNLWPGAKQQVYYVDVAPPYLPLLITRDGDTLATFSDWNSAYAAPTAPPAAQIVDLPTG